MSKGRTPKSTAKKPKTKDIDTAESDSMLEIESKEKMDTMLDAVVHRVRNLHYMPQGILAMKSSPTSKYVAVSREGGAVELVDPSQKFRIVSSISGLRERSVDSLTWVSTNMDKGGPTTRDEGLLFGASRDGTVFRLDFEAMSHRSTMNAGGGAILTMEAITLKGKGTKRRLFAVGCEDGTARILEYTEPEETIIQVAALSMGGNSASPVLSLSWNQANQVLLGSVSDGTIRRFDCTNFERQIYKSSNVRITVENYGRRTPTRVWSLLLLDDMTIVSGDSLGHVQFWDGKLGTLLRSYDQNPERADVLTLCVNKKQTHVFASGIDSRVVCFKKQDGRWISTTAQRPHTHDVKALCIYSKRKSSGSNMEFLASGGTDTKLCTYVVDSFKEIRPKKYFPWPSTSPIHLAKTGRIIAMRRDHSIDLYNIKDRNSVNDMFSAQPGQPKSEKNHKIGTIDINSAYNLVCSTISNKGDLLAISDGAGLMLFSLSYTKDGKKNSVSAKLVNLPAKAKQPCSAILFSDDGGALICASVEGPIIILSIDSTSLGDHDLNIEIIHSFDDFVSDVVPISQLAISPDGKWLAAGKNMLGNGAIHIFAIDGNGTPETSYKHWWPLPELEAPQSCIKFWDDPDVETTLVVGCANNAFYMFDIRERCLSEWSQDAGIPIQKKMPRELVNQADYPVRLVFNPASPSKFVMVSNHLNCSGANRKYKDSLSMVL